MVLDEIKILLEKYDNGKTTLLEEQQLKDYFSQETVAPELEVYQPLFAYFSQSQKEQFTKDVPLKPEKTFTMYKWISVAAIAVLMFGITIFNPFERAERTYAQLTEQEKMDYDNAMLAFNLLSSNFKKGTDNMSAMTKVSEKLNEGQRKLALLSEFDNATDRVFKY
ncbi:MAG: hypothetical protein HKP00_01970 [Flavobacteriaceae bacterium]|nr:hypothetical protein [Flavobacteriaceae bacterium]